MLELRPAREDDLDRLLEIHTSAFPDPRGLEERRRNFAANPRGELSDLHVVYDRGRRSVVAHAFAFPLELWIGGRRVPTTGVASVGVAPEARGRGVARFVLDALHDVGRARGDALALLYAFRYAFYVARGYAPVTPSRSLAFAPRSVPRAWCEAARDLGIRAATGDDRACIEEAHARAAARTTGWPARTRRFWERHFADERRAFFVDPNARGYVAWRLEQPQPHAAIALHVEELVADDAAVRRALLGLVGAQRDQVHEATIDVALDDPLDRALVDSDRHRFGDARVEHPLGVLVGGPLVRLLDPERALAARGYPAGVREDVVLDLGDGAPPLRVSLDGDGGASVTRAPGVEPDLACSAPALAQMAFGALGPRDAEALGLVRARDEAALGRAARCLHLTPFHALDAF